MNYHTSRKEFLHTSAAVLFAAIAGKAYRLPKEKVLLSFSTLGCPDWTFQQIIDFAADHGYRGIELRGIKREMDLTKCKEFSSLENISSTLTRTEKKGLRIVNLGASANLHEAAPAKRKENLDEARRFIDLAQQINCPYIRVFPNNLPKTADRQAVLDLIAKGLHELGEHAKGTNVRVLMETHGDLVHSADIEQVMKAVHHAQTGLVWDVTNMWSITKEPPAEVYARLKKYIFHTHIKDGKLVNGEIQYSLLGKGEVPIFEAIDLLQKNGYKGFYSFEWEKMWHPELADPELALADYPLAMERYLAGR